MHLRAEMEAAGLWDEIYRKAFPTMIGMFNHDADGDPQRHGIDRTITLADSRQIRVDEKVRGYDYGDIALEYLSDRKRGTPGWVCKPLLADFIAYAIVPTGQCYLLPVPQLQAVWQEYGECWLAEATPDPGPGERKLILAPNRDPATGRSWTTASVAVKPDELYPLIEALLRINFTPHDPQQPPNDKGRDPGYLLREKMGLKGCV